MEPRLKAKLTAEFCQRGETFEELCNRIAAPLADTPAHYHKIRALLASGRFLPGPAVWRNCGTTRWAPLHEGFASGPIGDSLTHGDGSIMQRATEAAGTLQLGGAVGYDFSTLRPSGSRVARVQAAAAGPVSFMRLFDALGPCLGAPRQRQLAILRVDHPDCELFVRSAPPWMRLGVAVTKDFMAAVQRGTTVPLQWGGSVDARALWEIIMRAAWERGDLVVFFVDTCNEQNPLRYCETIATLEPSTLTPVPAHGGVLHASVSADLTPEEVEAVLRALDNALDKAVYPLPAQAEAAKATRPLAISLAYQDPEAIARINELLLIASVRLAAERGPFPQFGVPYLKAAGLSKMPLLKKGALRHGRLMTDSLGPFYPERRHRVLTGEKAPPSWEDFKQTFMAAWLEGQQVLVVSVQP